MSKAPETQSKSIEMTNWKTAKTERFGQRKNTLNENRKHTVWVGGSSMGTFGPAAPAVSLVTGEVLKPSREVDAKMDKLRREERRKHENQLKSR